MVVSGAKVAIEMECEDDSSHNLAFSKSFVFLVGGAH